MEPIGPQTPAMSYYQVLDVAPSATRVEIRESYLRLKSTYGAGSAALYSLISEEEATEQMALVEEAYRVLNDASSRRNYDLSRSGAKVAASMDPEGPAAPADPGTVKTTRSTLPIIKMRASRAGSDEMKGKMEVMIAGADPGDGDLYKRLRETCEVSEDELCERTKISIAYLRAIEVNRFERLPQAVYVKGFLRSYFRYLCVPEAEKLVSAFSMRLSDWQANRKA